MIQRYGKKCFIEELGIRSREEVEADIRRYKKSKRKELMKLTFHHIKERQAGGGATEENGAILRNINHIWFNSLSLEEQEKINKLFQEYKAQDKFISFRERIKVNSDSDSDKDYERYILERRARERAKEKWQGHVWGTDEREDER